MGFITPQGRPRKEMFRGFPSSRWGTVGPQLHRRSRRCLWHRYQRYRIELTIGLISQDLIPHASKIIGVDTSPAMVEVYNQKTLINGVSQKMHAFCNDILSGPEIPEELQNVDIVVCSMSFHHFQDINQSSKVLASLLKKGGHLLIVDLFEGNSFRSVSNHR